ncbi:MAG: M55 family metallopeptidase [Chloroflexi bacterium]|nr:M55 family metallopeptidase [Chloroflexota bacterium]
MRILLWTGMEGMSEITDHHECWPVFPHYWQTGRRKFTADVVAAASGLLEGGATEVVVMNGHGLGWPNVLWEDLPDQVRPYGRGSRGKGFDGLFQVGFHARCGTTDGFISHTFVPHFRVAVDGALVTESHAAAWLVGVPLLGITGDAALEAQVDGILNGTPFLAVKRSSSRSETTPLYGNGVASADAIRAFARRCAQEWRQRKPPALPSPFTVAMSLDPHLTQAAVGRHGLVRSSPAVLTVEAEDWGRDVEPALGAAMGAALRPLLAAQEDLDLSSEAAMQRQEPAKLERLRRYFVDWVHANYPAWQV